VSPARSLGRAWSIANCIIKRTFQHRPGKSYVNCLLRYG
jgi:hypothetical protein